MTSSNLLGVPETLLPEESEVQGALAAGSPLVEIVTAHPSSSLAWALLSDAVAGGGADSGAVAGAEAGARALEAYAYARVGYHRGLDALRKAGWRGQGPVPWAHEPNRGVLRALFALRRGAAAIGETAEVERLTTFLNDADPAALVALENPGE